MGWRDTLKKDIARREEQIKRGEELIKWWESALRHPPPPPHHIPLPRAGIDFAYGRPHPAQLRHAGVTFVCRYLGGSPDKDLTAAEAEDYSAAGIEIVTVYESTADRSLGGYGVGASDARGANAALQRVHAPAHAPVYFAVDFDAQEFHLPEIEHYFKGVADHLGRDRCGVYGGLRVVAHLLSTGTVRYGWQTLAWSGGLWSTRAQLRQVENGLHIAGIEADKDMAVAADFGQWKL